MNQFQEPIMTIHLHHFHLNWTSKHRMRMQHKFYHGQKIMSLTITQQISIAYPIPKSVNSAVKNPNIDKQIPA